MKVRMVCISTNFYPRSPCGERRRGRAGILRICDFYPRSPCGERQWMRVDFLTVEEISIHALLAESDAPDQRAAHGTSDFYPRSPCGERPGTATPPRRRKHGFLSTLSLRRATSLSSTALHTALFLSTLSLRRATAGRQCGARAAGYFYPRSPCGERLYDTYAKVLRVNISIHALLAESDIPLCLSI